MARQRAAGGRRGIAGVTGARRPGELDELAGWLSDAYAPAYRTACLILRNPADAEEAVQEAFLRAWRFRSAAPKGEQVRAWLYRVVVNACCSKLRHEIRHRDRRAPEDALASLASAWAMPDESAESADLASALSAALDELPDWLRIPLILRYYADLSEADIARAIDRRAGTVKSRLAEARRRLAANQVLATYHVAGGAR